jgi:carbonic anhydrase/acetyltransferase-like protein (isoleucine patch superfamily)
MAGAGRERLMLYEFDGRKPFIGTGTYVSETATVIGDVRIGNDCYIGHGAILRGDYGTIEIGAGTAVEEGVIVHAPPQDSCTVGKRVTIGHGAVIHAKAIGDAVTIGMGAILSIRSEVASGSIVAEGAIVKREQKIPESVVAAGNPARKIREVTQEEKEYGNWAVQLYIDLARKYLEQGMKRITTP